MVQTIFRSYLKLGSLNLLMTDLRKRGIVTKVRTLKTGKTVGGIAFTRGPLAHLLRNRFYIGEVAFKGDILAGEQLAIVDRNLFDAVQAKLDQQLNNHNAARIKSGALLAGRIFDDCGNRMSPSHACKRGIKYRYYLSAALNQGHAERAGSLRRVPAVEVEALVTKSVREHLKLSASFDDLILVNTHVVRVEVQAGQLVIQFTPAQKSNRRRARAEDTLLVPWQKTASTRRREIILSSPGSSSSQNARPIRSETRATLVASIARGRRWLAEIISDPSANAETIAARESCSIRKVNMTISLAFLAPHLVKAAIEGRLPHGMGVVRLCDLSAEWFRQSQMLGLIPQ